MTRLVALAGSARRDSLNKTLARWAGRFAESLGAQVTVVDLANFEVPLYNGDLEQDSGIPENASQLRGILQGADGLIIASPEYNGSLTPLLKNVIDWTSRPEGDTPGLAAWRGKTAAILAASPGGLGGLRGLAHLRDILSGIGVFVLPTQCAVSQAHKAFDVGGDLTDERIRGLLEVAIRELVATTGALKA
ncbi:MAG: NAD(P)H-dependent oxidoreductase [Acidobacteriota bacterium]